MWKWFKRKVKPEWGTPEAIALEAKQDRRIVRIQNFFSILLICSAAYPIILVLWFHTPVTTEAFIIANIFLALAGVLLCGTGRILYHRARYIGTLHQRLMDFREQNSELITMNRHTLTMFDRIAKQKDGTGEKEDA